MTAFGKLSKLKEVSENPDGSPDLPDEIKIKSRFSDETPEAYIKGWIEFYKLKFRVTPDVLIPRPETELLIDEVLAGVKPLMQNSRGFTPTILDMGTGSGCIAISIAKNLAKARIFAMDISQNALDIASENAKRNRVDKRIFFIKSDLLTSVKDKTKIDIIVTNLPYIPRGRMPFLDSSVKDFEPRLALEGGQDGFDIYRDLFIQMKEKKIIPKIFIGEIDDSHGILAQIEAKKYFPKAKIEVKNDLTKTPRILKITF